MSFEDEFWDALNKKKKKGEAAIGDFTPSGVSEKDDNFASQFWAEMEEFQKELDEKREKRVAEETQKKKLDKEERRNAEAEEKKKREEAQRKAEFQKSLSPITPSMQGGNMFSNVPEFGTPEHDAYFEALGEEYEAEKAKSEGYFKAGSFDDGYQFGDVTKATGATVSDAVISAGEGFGGFFEGISDLLLHGTGYVSGWLGMAADKVGLDGVASGLDSASDFLHDTADINSYGLLADEARDVLNIGDNSVLGDKSRGVGNALGQIGGIVLAGKLGQAAGLSSLGNTALTTGTVFTSSAGSGITEARQFGSQYEDYKQMVDYATEDLDRLLDRGDITEEQYDEIVSQYDTLLDSKNVTAGEAIAYGTMKGTIEAGTEMLFGGLGKAVNAIGLSRGIGGVDDILAQKLTAKIGNRLLKTTLQAGVKASGEGLEEVIAGYLSAVAKKLSYRSDEELEQLIEDEELLDAFLQGFLASGISQGPGVIQSVKTDTDFVSNLTSIEESVINREVEKRIEQAEKDGKKLSKSDKSKIQDEVMSDLDKGYISTDTIEEVLGGDTYKSYQDTVKSEDSLVEQEKTLRDEYEELGKKTNPSLAEQSRFGKLETQLEELKTKIEDTRKTSERDFLQRKYRSEAAEIAKGSRLEETYRERARGSQKFEADVSKYKGVAKKSIESIIEKGQMNNSNKAHDLIDWAVNLAAARGKTVTTTTTEEILKKAEAKYGKQYVLDNFYKEVTDENGKKKLVLKAIPNAELDGDTIALNVDSPNLTMTIIGHELGHTFEGTKYYNEVADLLNSYDKTVKGNEAYETRKAATEGRYQNIAGANAQYELNNDLLGEYIFSDEGFVKHLTQNRNVFQKIYDQIKYMVKIATAGSQQKKDLLRIQQTFEKAWREAEKAQGATQTDVKHSISEIDEATAQADAQKAVERFGTTSKFEQTGYVLADGRMLNMTRDYNVYHDQISEIFSDVSGREAVNRFIQEGNVRLVPVSSGIEIGETPLSTNQLNVVSRFVGNSLRSKGYFFIDITGKDGKNIATFEYDSDSTASDVIYDIKQYYERGRIPSKKVWYSLSEDTSGRKLTAEQKEFFKDSKVVDENGSLKVMYHGTSNGGHTVFDTYGSHYGLFGTGSYFTDSKDVAEGYTKKGKGNNPQVYESYLNITNPIDMDAQADAEAWQNAFPEASFPESGTNEDFYRAMEEYFEDNEYSRGEASEMAMEALEGMGYDGITHIGGGRVNANGANHQVYIAFHPEQIKDIGNAKPTGDPDVRYSLSESNQEADTDSRIHDMQVEVNKLTQSIKEIEKTDEYKTAMNALYEAIDRGDIDNGVMAYSRWQTDSGYADMVERRDSLQVELNNLLKEEKERESIKAVEREKAAIEKSGLSEAEYFRKQAVKEFGYTTYFDNAGYITPNGKMLNFSGEKGKRYPVRGQDHRAIGILYVDTKGTDAMNRFVRDGNIRIMAESPGLDMSTIVEPSKEQYSTIRKFVSEYSNKGYFSVDFTDESGTVIGSLTYENRINPTRIVNDIKHYYETGEIRQPSDLERFRYSLSEDSQGRELTKEQTDFFRDSKIVDENGNLRVMYHGTPNGEFTIFRDGTYFTANKEYADKYQNPSASSLNSRKVATSPKTFEVYLNITKPFDINDPEARSIYIKDYIKGGNAIGINPYLSDAEYDNIRTIDWTEGEDLREFLVENGYDYDGLVLDEGAVGGYGEDVEYRGTSYVVFSPEQVKSVDNQNPTSNRDINLSLSDADAEFAPTGYNVPLRDLRLETLTENAYDPSVEAPMQEDIAPVETAQDMFPDDYAPMSEDESAAEERLASLDESVMPPENEPYYGEDEVSAPADPFENRDIKEVGNRKVKAYMYENPEVKPFFQEEANIMLGELNDTVKGERIYSEEGGWTGTSRYTSDDIAYLRDSLGYTYAEIEKGLNAIIEDDGAENNAISKRIEFILNDRLADGYTDFRTGMGIPANQEYINLLNEKQITDYSREAWDNFVSTADQYAPPAEDDMGPVVESAPIKEEYEAIRPPKRGQRRGVEAPDEIGPVAEGVEYGDKLVRVDSPYGTERSWYGTSTRSKAVDGAFTPDDIPNELRYYEVKSNRRTLDRVNARLESLGYEKAVEAFEANFSAHKVTLDDMVLGQRLIQEAVKRGDLQTAIGLDIDVSVLGTELGQMVQSMSIIQRLSPEGQLRALRRIVDRGQAKGDRAFDGVEVTDDIAKEITDVYKEDGTFDQDELNAAVERAKQKIADQMKVTKWDKANAWRYFAMLGNAKTHDRNVVSNIANFATRIVKNALARTGEDVFLRKSDSRTKTWKMPSKEVREYAKQFTKEHKDSITGPSKYSESSDLKSKRRIFKNKALHTITEANSKLLEAEDALFSRPTFRMALAEYLTANGIKTREDIKNNPKTVLAAEKYAKSEAKKSTFQQDSFLASKIKEIEQRGRLWEIGVGAVMPFKKTPINIAKTGIAYSPIGFLRGVYDLTQIKSGKVDATTAIDHLAEGITGTSLAVIGYALASMGALNGAGDDDKEGKFDYQLGKSSYSIKIGDEWHSLNWLSPVAMPLFVGANAYEVLVEKEEWDFDMVSDALGKTLDPMSEMSFLSSLDSVLSSYGSGTDKFFGAAESMAQSYATQYIPTLFSQTAQMFDDKKRSTKPSKDSKYTFGEETWNKIRYKVPFLRNTLEPSTDIWGNEIELTDNVLAKSIETFLAPWNTKDNIETEIDTEIKSLYSQTGATEVVPTTPYNYFDYKGEKYEMSASEHTAFKNTYGQTAYNLLEELFDTDTYQDASAEEKADMVSKVYDYARDEARRKLLAGRGVSFTNATKDNVEYYRENPIKGAIENDMSPDEYTFYQENTDKYNFLRENNVSYRQWKSFDEDTKEAYTWAFKNPEKRVVAKAVADDFVQYRKYASDLYDIKADKDADGKTISGSRKDKVLDYINGLNADYGEKIILFKSEYPSDDTYNYEIIDYLNSRDDISYDEMNTILKELGFTVNGNQITWD